MLLELWTCFCIILSTQSHAANGFTARPHSSPVSTGSGLSKTFFGPERWWEQPARISSRRMATLMPEEKVETPATVFGQPLDQATKDMNRELVHTLKNVLFDRIFSGEEITRYYARFYALETIARMPYFAYVSVLHLYETLGRWRKADILKIHFCESWNELHHLLIMEELGGADRWADRFVAQHIAFGYYWMVVFCYLINPSFAYNLNQHVEEEAYQTYNNFLHNHREYLADLPPPEIAVKYYTGDDLYLYDEMHFNGDTLSSSSADSSNGNSDHRRRPKIENLLDVFVAIRDDEMEHAKTMLFMQEASEEKKLS